jgi:hypothetical protein
MRGALLGALVGGQTVKYAREGEVLLLKTVNADGAAYRGFQWPRTGEVVAPDWNPDPDCGGGLHGLLRGCGDASALSNYSGAIWIVFAARESEVVEFDGKAKAPRGRVVYYGERQRAIDLLCEEYPDAPIVYRTATAGDYGMATAGYCGTASAGYDGTAAAGHHGTATAGDEGTATAGDEGTATAGHRGTASAGDYGTASAGDYGTVTAGGEGTATAGDYGMATAGDRGTASAGDYGTASAGDYGTVTAGGEGTATAGYEGTATAGDYGMATAGYYGTATAGKNGCIQLKYWDGERTRIVTGYIGENGLEPNVPYKLDENHQFVKA